MPRSIVVYEVGGEEIEFDPYDVLQYLEDKDLVEELEFRDYDFKKHTFSREELDYLIKTVENRASDDVEKIHILNRLYNMESI